MAQTVKGFVHFLKGPLAGGRLLPVSKGTIGVGRTIPEAVKAGGLPGIAHAEGYQAARSVVFVKRHHGPDIGFRRGRSDDLHDIGSEANAFFHNRIQSFG